MAKATIPENIRKLEERFAHELLPAEERLELLEAIKRLKKRAETKAAGARG